MYILAYFCFEVDMEEVKRVKLLDQHTEIMGRGQAGRARKGSGASKLKTMMSFDVATGADPASENND